jgi:hypothetical protein
MTCPRDHPTAALDAYVEGGESLPSDWKETPRPFSIGNEFSRMGRASPDPNVAIVIVDRVTGGGFRATGDCVGAGEA